MSNEDKVLLITGASSGIGAATARAAARNGYRLALCARSEDKLESLVEEIGESRACASPCWNRAWSTHLSSTNPSPMH